jgi:ATP/maltotriose-dependent transcriptional regulator MalT
LDLLQARAHLGIRNFGKASLLLDRLTRIADEHDESYVAVETALVRSRVFLTEGICDRAVQTLRGISDFSMSRGERGECLANLALAHASTGQLERAHLLIEEALATTRCTQVATLASSISAIIALENRASEGPQTSHHAFMMARAGGDLDSYVSAYRAYPKLLETPARDEAIARALAQVLRRARDDRLARKVGLRPERPRERGHIGCGETGASTLSAREKAVLDLMAQGLTNRQIGSALFIQESTAKVHVRHIFEKLGARTRLEAVRKARPSEWEI